MKIAIVSPSPKPFVIGGAEKLWAGLYNFISTNTEHQCELIKIVVNEDSFWGLIDSYYNFFKLDLSHFDMVISGKYPAWMVQHRNHHVYMLHCLRGLYDTYHIMNLPYEVDSRNSKINMLLELIRRNEALHEVFNYLFSLKADEHIPKSYFAFPGPLIRILVHYFDSYAMKNIISCSAISHTVAQRRSYFHSHNFVNVIYPPSSLQKYPEGKYNYFFTVSRLDEPKRIGTIIEAYKKSRAELPLKIAGTGPLSNQLIQQAKEDTRIEFLGFVSDQKLVELYSNAFAVIFIPYDEDYGLITLEAMLFKKPVITFFDSGGVAEFVENGVTGIITKPNTEFLTQSINDISKKYDVKKLGENAYKKVENITWQKVYEKLILPFQNKPEKTLLVISTYKIYPPLGGGQNRLFFLYREVAKHFNVEIICLGHESDTYSIQTISPNLTQILIPKSNKHAVKEYEVSKQVGIPVTDIVFSDIISSSEVFINEVKNRLKYSSGVILSHPYPYRFIKSLVTQYVSNSIPLIHDSHNCEYILKSSMLNDSELSKELLNKLYADEREIIVKANLNAFCSQEDLSAIESNYEINVQNSIVIENGVDLESIRFYGVEQREYNKQKLGLEAEKIILFIGSYHQPNIDAVYQIIKIAAVLTSYKFIIAGSVGVYFENLKDIKLPINVGFAGMISDTEKFVYFSIADVAINPMVSGSGTNLKMLDYMGSGIPVVSTNVGIRGLGLSENMFILSDIENFASSILSVINGSIVPDIIAARLHVEENFTWQKIGKKYSDQLKQLTS